MSTFNPIDYTDETIKNYEFIIHLSDIHIRLQSRREEYEHVFKNLYSKIDEIIETTPKTGLIVITGDIFHDKTNLSPESIKLSLDLFEELSNRYKTIVIQGNHDGLLNIEERMDNITGVLIKKQISNFHYLKHSGIYKFNNIVFGLSSLFDNKFIKSQELDNYLDYYNLPNDTLKIALYHGMVGNVAISELYEAKGYYKTDDFKGYDYALLGDVHTFQYLNPEKTMAYASSLIGQNFAETDENHGFIHWDLKNHTSHYVIVPNMYCYKTASLDNNIITINNEAFDIKDPKMLEILKTHIPEHGQIKIIINSDECNENMKFLKSTFKKVKWTENNMSNLSTNSVNQLLTPNKNQIYLDLNLRDIIRANVIKNDNIMYDENIINFINNDLETRIKTKERHARSWELLKLNFSNLCIYGGEQEINFATMPYNEVILISGNNNVGKSSLIDIITFILYNRMARELNIGRKIANDIINVNKKSGYGELHIKIADKVYIIRKEISRGASNKITIKPVFYEVACSENTLLYNSADKVAEAVEDIFGTFDDFIFMNMMLQFDNVPFRSMKQPDRKELLNRLLGLDQYEQIETDIKPVYKDIERTYNELKKKLDKVDPQSLNDKISQTMIKIDELSNIISKDQDEKDDITLKIDELNKSYKAINEIKDLPPMKQLHKKRQELTNDIDKIDEQIEQINENKKTDEGKDISDEEKNNAFERMSSLLLERKNEYPTNKKYKSITIIDKFIEEISNELSELSKLTDDLKDIDNKISSINQIEPYKPPKSIYYYESKVEELNEELKEKTEQLTKNESVIKKHEKIIKEDNSIILDAFDNYKILMSNLAILKNELLVKEDIYKELSEHEYNPECAQCMKNPKTTNLLKLNTDISSINKNIESILSKIDNSIPEKKEEYDKIKLEYDKMREECLKLREAIQLLRTQIKKMSDNIILVNEYKKYVENSENLSKMIKERDIIKTKLNRFTELQTQKIELEFELQAHNNNIKIREINRKIDEEILIHKTIITAYERYMEMRNLEIKITEYNQSKWTKEQELNEIRKNILLIKEDEERIESNSQLDNTINVLKRRSETFEKKIMTGTLEKNNLENIIKNNSKILSEYNKDKEEFNELQYEFRKYETYMAILHKNGITLSIIERNLDYIEKGVNSIIGRFIKKNVKLSIERNNIELDIIINDENSKEKEVRMLGGRETFIMDIGFKIMLAKIGKMTKSNMLFIDEGISVFDIENMNGIKELFEYLTQNYERVFIMSHIDIIKDMVQRVIHVKNDGINSRLQ